MITYHARHGTDVDETGARHSLGSCRGRARLRASAAAKGLTPPGRRATVVAVRPGRGPASVRIAHQGPHGTEVRRWVTPAALRQVTVQQALQGTSCSDG